MTEVWQPVPSATKEIVPLEKYRGTSTMHISWY